MTFFSCICTIKDININSLLISKKNSYPSLSCMSFLRSSSSSYRDWCGISEIGAYCVDETNGSVEGFKFIICPPLCPWRTSPCFFLYEQGQTTQLLRQHSMILMYNPTINEHMAKCIFVYIGKQEDESSTYLKGKCQTRRKIHLEPLKIYRVPSHELAAQLRYLHCLLHPHSQQTTLHIRHNPKWWRKVLQWEE